MSKFIRAMKKKYSARIESANSFGEANIKGESDIKPGKSFVLPSYLFRAIYREMRRPISFSASHLRRSTTREIQPDPYKLFRFPHRERERERQREEDRGRKLHQNCSNIKPGLIFKNASILDKGHLRYPLIYFNKKKLTHGNLKLISIKSKIKIKKLC